MNELLGPLVLFAAAVTLTPGPNVVLVTASAANFGFRRTIPQIPGITFGFGTEWRSCSSGPRASCALVKQERAGGSRSGRP